LPYWWNTHTLFVSRSGPLDQNCYLIYSSYQGIRIIIKSIQIYLIPQVILNLFGINYRTLVIVFNSNHNKIHVAYGSLKWISYKCTGKQCWARIWWNYRRTESGHNPGLPPKRRRRSFRVEFLVRSVSTRPFGLKPSKCGSCGVKWSTRTYS